MIDTPRERPRGRGRPSRFTTERRAEILRLIEAGNPLATAARASGIGVTTFKRWLVRGRSIAPADAEYRSFRAEVHRARAKGETAALEEVLKAAKGGDWRAAAWVLERRWPKAWGRVDRLKAEVLSSSGDKPAVDREAMALALSDPEACRLMAELDARMTALPGGPPTRR